MITYNKYINENKIIAKAYSNNLDDNNLNKLIKTIHDMNIEDNSFNNY